MAYITISNSKRIIKKQKLEPLYDIRESIYKKDIYFLSKREVAILKGIRELLRDSGNFVVKYYNPIEVVDTFRYLYPETVPAYHVNSSCERLNSNFLNIEVPEPIREKGKDEVLKFRKWYKEISHKIDTAKDVSRRPSASCIVKKSDATCGQKRYDPTREKSHYAKHSSFVAG